MAAIIGWAHSRFGKLDDEDLESLIAWAAREAVIDAGAVRLRPILMTSMATILGVLPLALALGDASTSRIPMGIAIIGGLIFSLILTLYVIPSLYTYISSKSRTRYVEEENI